jgi:glycopeptide antibiotics resistance protein
MTVSPGTTRNAHPTAYGGIILGILVSLKTVAPIMVVVLIGILAYMKKKQQRSTGYLISFAVFYVYLLYVSEYTIFPLRLFAPAYTKLMIDQGGTWRDGLNLVPFRDVSIAYLRSVQGWGNLVLTVPFGFGLPFVGTTDFKAIAWRGIIFPVFIELAQLLLNFAYRYSARVVDVNDVLFNFAGVLIGFALFRALAGLYRKTTSPHEPVTGPWEHMHDVLTQS